MTAPRTSSARSTPRSSQTLRTAVAGALGGAVAPDEPGRNDPCPCGSGAKYKKCCGR